MECGTWGESTQRPRVRESPVRGLAVQPVHTCPGEAARQPSQMVLNAEDLLVQARCKVTGCPLSQASWTCTETEGGGGEGRRGG